MHDETSGTCVIFFKCYKDYYLKAMTTICDDVTLLTMQLKVYKNCKIIGLLAYWGYMKR